MYTSENPHFNTTDKILLSLVAFSILWVFLKAYVDWCEGYGPYGWRWKQLQKEVDKKKTRNGYKRRRATTPPRGQRRRRIISEDSDREIHQSENNYTSSSADGYSSEYSSDSKS